MKRSGIFWGVALLLVGTVLLLDNLNIIPDVNIWGIVWPLLLVLLGVSVLLGAAGRGGTTLTTEHVSVGLDGAEMAHVDIDHGIGPARLTGAAEPGTLLSGRFTGMKHRIRRDGTTARLTMDMRDDMFPMMFPWGLTGDMGWEFQLNGQVPLTLNVDGGAGMLDFDLTDLRVTRFTFDAGVGQSTITMPAHAGHTTADVDAGVGELRIRIPEGVAVRMQVEGGLGSVHVSSARFNNVGSGRYHSPEYDSAENKLDLTVDGGVGAISIT